MQDAICRSKRTGDQYRSLFHHGLVKILVKYQLYFIGKTWDQFLDENGFGKNEVWPSVRPKTQQKNRWSRGSKTAEVNDELNPKDSRVKNPIQSIGLEDGLDKNSEGLVENLNMSYVSVDQFEPKKRIHALRMSVGSLVVWLPFPCL